VRGSSELTASGHHLHTSSLCTSSPCMVILLPPVVEPALASALPRRRSLRGRPRQGIAVRDLVALRAGLFRAATLQLHPRISALPTPRAATPPRACATYSSAYRACQTRVFTLQLSRPASPVFPRLVHSRASMHQRPLCSATHVLLDPCGHITSLRSCPRRSRTDALLPLRCASTLARPTPASQRRPLA
jgi:hypothetical protein